MKLYDYFRSSAAYRVRIALNLKGLTAEREFVHLRNGAHREAGYMAVNPVGLVPSFTDGDMTIAQSLAIIEYLDEVHPEPSLLPGSAADRARIRSISQQIAADIHPLNNLRILEYVDKDLGAGPEGRMTWIHHWIHAGFRGLEVQLANDAETGLYCHGDTPTLADICLVPQVFSGQRFEVDLSPYPKIMEIFDRLNTLPAFADAAPGRQPDAE